MDIKKTPLRGTRRPTSSTSPSSAASSTDGQSKANGRIVDRRTFWCGTKTVFRIRNRNSTISSLLETRIIKTRLNIFIKRVSDRRGPSRAVIAGLGADPDVASRNFDAYGMKAWFSGSVIGDVVLACECLPDTLHRRTDGVVLAKINHTAAGLLRKRIDRMFIDQDPRAAG